MKTTRWKERIIGGMENESNKNEIGFKKPWRGSERFTKKSRRNETVLNMKQGLGWFSDVTILHFF
jgi:hypothetical protein